MDQVDVLLGTGLRIGELCGLRWSDLDLTSMPVTVTVTGQAKRTAAEGFHWQGFPKSAASYRTLSVPKFVGDLLRRRRAESPDSTYVFETRDGTMHEPNNTRRALRDALGAAPELAGITPHTFRRTVATMLDRGAGIEAAAAQLGHSNTALTAARYVKRAIVAPDHSAILDSALGGKLSA